MEKVSPIPMVNHLLVIADPLSISHRAVEPLQTHDEELLHAFTLKI